MEHCPAKSWSEHEPVWNTFLAWDDSISSTHSSFILEVFNESRDSNTLLGVAGVIACLYFKLQTLADASPDPEKEIITDNDFIEFIRNSQPVLQTFHSAVRPDDLPNDLKIYHWKIRNIDTLLAWWLRKPYPIGKEYRIGLYRPCVGWVKGHVTWSIWCTHS